MDALNAIREQEIGQIGLMVNRGRSNEVLRGTFLIEIPMLHIADQDLNQLKPDPLMLVASISADLELKLNQDAGPKRRQLCFSSAPHGLRNDPANLQRWLACLFDNRTKQHAYKIGMETRMDVPLEQRIEKTLFVKAPRSVKYVDVLRVIDAAKGAGANPVGLQIDDLPR